MSPRGSAVMSQEKSCRGNAVLPLGRKKSFRWAKIVMHYGQHLHRHHGQVSGMKRCGFLFKRMSTNSSLVWKLVAIALQVSVRMHCCFLFWDPAELAWL